MSVAAFTHCPRARSHHEALLSAGWRRAWLQPFVVVEELLEGTASLACGHTWRPGEELDWPPGHEVMCWECSRVEVYAYRLPWNAAQCKLCGWSRDRRSRRAAHAHRLDRGVNVTFFALY